jgi:hypothetical protein
MKTRVMLFLTGLAMALMNQNLIGETIEFSTLGESGVLSRELSEVTPSEGCLKLYDLDFPEFKKVF